MTPRQRSSWESEPPHQDLALNGVGAMNNVRAEEHFTCGRCRAVFARILAGPPTRQVWMLRTLATLTPCWRARTRRSAWRVLLIDAHLKRR
ncbi:hypothetical protein FSB65_22660 [Paraburkholderia sp. JPY418]|uniref:Uncharacterized protein n=1 Tax=Paraburkholderia youngii TaxID=2782701 RepID=A0ABX2NV65_9BURK|nr:hypothetical protein [Paraburkholderia youngii]NVI08339.1 hypothetical protein [Paraburkholderia youngii]